MNGQENNEFQYHYSSREQAELQNIRKKYLEDSKTKKFDKMERIRKLDASVTNKASVASLAVGILSALVMGAGMSLVMTDWNLSMGLSGESALLIGIIIGVIGMAGVIFAYPLYQIVLRKERKKIAPEILRLTEELMEKENK